MTSDWKKEQVVSEAIQLLIKNKGLKLKIHKMWVDNTYFNVELEYTIHKKTKIQEFGFVAKWFDPNCFEMSWIKELQIPANATDYQKVLLKIAYYFYKWYKEKSQ